MVEATQPSPAQPTSDGQCSRCPGPLEVFVVEVAKRSTIGLCQPCADLVLPAEQGQA